LKNKEPLVIQDQGSFSAGGIAIHSEGQFDPNNPPDPFTPPADPFAENHNGQSLHGDNAHVFYQIPQNPRELPLVFLHGGFQTAKCWQTTVDGREGFQNIFLRRNFSVYLVDQPRRGAAGRSTVPNIVPAILEDETQFNIYRFGLWPNFYEGVQFPPDHKLWDEFLLSVTNNHGPYDAAVITDAMSAVFDKVGDGILITHSQSGGLGWLAAARNPHIKAIVSYEPGSCFLFPEGEVPETKTTCLPWNVLPASGAPMEDFLKLTKIPIIIYYGDNIASEPDKDLGRDHWRVRSEMAQLFVDKVNAYGGDATLVKLPEIGIYGNTHFIFSDLNNLEIADLLSQWLHEKGFDLTKHPISPNLSKER